TGNTEKVANAIKQGLEERGVEVTVKRVEEAEEIDWFCYDLVCIGSPSYQWHTPEPMTRYLQGRFNIYRHEGRVRLGSPRAPGKYALVFCTYSGPHTGIKEALPCGKYIGQFLDKMGFTLLDEWYIIGEFHGSVENSTRGRLGDIRGKPTLEELDAIRLKASELVSKIWSP
ncbi:MAG: flavodoxin domain-containing protein, partial [Candidatus Bathyarchaeia archaeon]